MAVRRRDIHGRHAPNVERANVGVVPLDERPGRKQVPLRRRCEEGSSGPRDLRGEEVDVLEEREVGWGVLLDLVEGSAHAGEEVLLHVGEEVWLPGCTVCGAALWEARYETELDWLLSMGLMWATDLKAGLEGMS